MNDMEYAIEKAARVIGSVMSRWDMDGRPDVDGGIDTLIARALADAGLLAPAPLTEIRAENQFGETHRRWATDWERYEKDPRG